MEEISELLEKQYDLSISVIELYAHVQYYKKKIQSVSEPLLGSTPKQSDNRANPIVLKPEEIKEDDAFNVHIPVQKPKKFKNP